MHVPLVVVMGHSSCGAVKAAMNSHIPAKTDRAGANLEQILSAIRPSLPRASRSGDPWLNAVYASIEQNLFDVVRLSPVLAELGRAGRVHIVGAFYDLGSGRVHFSEPMFLAPERGNIRRATSGAAMVEAHR